MSDDRSASESLGGISATAVVVRGGNREVTVSVDLVCLHPDGQFKYEVRAEAKVVIPAGDPLPVFVPRDRPRTIFSANHVPSPPWEIKAHTVCRSPEGNVKWEADTEPIALAIGEALPDQLIGCNTVVDAGFRPDGRSGGH